MNIGTHDQATTAGEEHAKPVDWYSPTQLIRTGIRVALSTILSRRSDPRLLEALDGSRPKPAYDHSSLACSGDAPDGALEVDADGSVWFDYVADCGDGFDATYAVAHAVCQPELTFPRQGSTESVRTRRGSILVFGGDQVYPCASRAAYRSRFVKPYELAAPATSTRPPTRFAYAIPGNHDWYDGLSAFMRLFCRGRDIAAFRTRQSRSYFALELPHGYWLLGLDVQLDSDIDEAQVNFFREVADKMKPHDSVILCTPEPAWIYSKMWSRFDRRSYTESNLAYLQREVLRTDSVRVIVAGDLHHYRRHESRETVGQDGSETVVRHKITAGGGGAFLHLTHGADVDRIVESASEAAGTPRTYELVPTSEFPSRSASKKLAPRALLFPFRHPSLGAGIAGIYVLFWLGIEQSMVDFADGSFRAGIGASILANPGVLCWPAVLFAGIYLFTDTHSRLFRGIAGTVHATVQVLCGLGAIHLASAATTHALAAYPWARLFASAALVMLAGTLLSGAALGVYLYLAHTVFGRHLNELSSAVASIDFKSFLRFRIDREGVLTIFPIGIERVPRAWAESSEGSRLAPADSDARCQPKLIEEPIVVKPGKTEPTESENTTRARHTR